MSIASAIAENQGSLIYLTDCIQNWSTPISIYVILFYFDLMDYSPIQKHYPCLLNTLSCVLGMTINQYFEYMK